MAPQVGLEPTTLRLTANEFAAPPAAIDCYKPLYDMHLSSQSHSADCYRLGSITIDFEGAWAQKWAQRNSCPLAQRICRKIAELFAIHGPVIPDFGPSWNVAP